MNKEDYMNEQGYCPKCHGYNLDYQPVEFEDTMVVFPYKCKDCGQEGEEWYNLEFAGHNIYKDNGEMLQL